MKTGTRKIEEWFIERELQYDLQEGENGGSDFIAIPCALENINGVQVFAAIGDEDIQMGMLNFIKVPDNKKMAVLEKINELNSKYRWVKLQLENGSVSATIDAIYDNDSIIVQWDNLTSRITSIPDACYPEIMKILWS